MICQLCCILLLYVPLTESRSVRVDGGIELINNFGFENSSLRSLIILPEIYELIDNISANTHAVSGNVSARRNLVTKNEEYEKKFDNMLKTDIRELASNFTEITSLEDTNLSDSSTDYETKRNENHKKGKNILFKRKMHTTFADRQTKPTDFEIKRYKEKKKKTKSKKRKQKRSPESSDNESPNDPPSLVGDGKKLIELLEKFGVIKHVMPTTKVQQYQTRRGLETFVKQQPVYRSRDLETIHEVKKDPRIRNFTLELFKQNINVLEELKARERDPNIQDKIDVIARSYRNKFGDFVRENEKQNIVTRLGTQKAVMNTIETSNRYMRRLLNFLTTDTEEKGFLRENESIKVWTQLMENEEQQEYVQACQKFNICRSKYSLSSFISDFFTVLLQVDDVKLRRAMDAFTETVKEKDLSRVMDTQMEKRLLSNIDVMEMAEARDIRPMLWMFRNMLITKNQPLLVHESTPKGFVNQSVALLDVVDILDERIQATEENLLVWNDLRNGLVQWANSQRDDIQEIMQAFVGMLVKKGIKKMDSNISRAFKAKFRAFLRASTD